MPFGPHRRDTAANVSHVSVICLAFNLPENYQYPLEACEAGSAFDHCTTLHMLEAFVIACDGLLTEHLHESGSSISIGGLSDVSACVVQCSSLSLKRSRHADRHFGLGSSRHWVKRIEDYELRDIVQLGIFHAMAKAGWLAPQCSTADRVLAEPKAMEGPNS